MPLVTWIACRCGHIAETPFTGKLAVDVLPKARCSRCGARGAEYLRHGFKADANALDGARVPRKGRERDN